MTTYYKNIRKGLASKPALYPIDTNMLDVIDTNNDWYESIYYYNEDQKKQIEATGTVSGIRDVVTDKLYFDFDCKDNVDKARQDACECARRLISMGFNEEDINAHFSGMKGFSLDIKVDRMLTPEQFKSIIFTVAGDLETFDTVVNDPSRIIRVPTTKHQKTGLHKTNLLLFELEEMSMDDIVKLAKTPTCFVETKVVSLPKKLEPSEVVASKDKKEVKKEVKKDTSYNINWSEKPRHWRNYKWALLQGFFEAQERHQALMIIAATCRGMGYDKEQTYYLCKSAIKKQAERTGQEEFSKEELYKNVIEKSVFSDRWDGGQYSPETNLWLKQYCTRMGIKIEESTEDKPCVSVTEVGVGFQKYSQEFEKNIIKTGIKRLDENCMLLAATHNGILGAPGSAKTTSALNILKHTSENNVDSVFLSLDMSSQIIYSKFIQQELGCGFKEAINLYKNNPKKASELDEKIKQKYKNVGFNFKAGLTVADIRHIVKEREQQTGQKVRLLVTDYLECLAAPMSDANAAQGYVTNQLKDLASELELCSLLLLQTQKHSTPDVSDPLLSMRQIKGASVLEQSMSVILTLWREAYNPKTIEQDKYISFAVVKNRFGSLWTGDFAWNGARGLISELSEQGHEELKEFRQEKATNKAKQDQSWR